MKADEPIQLQVGVKVLLKNNQGKYLLIKRSEKKYPRAAGRWDAVGGRIIPGATLSDNLAREVKEETGLEISGNTKLIGAQDILRVPGKHIIRLTYIGKTKPGRIQLDTEENDDFGWFSKTEMKKIEDLDKYVKELMYG